MPRFSNSWLSTDSSENSTENKSSKKLLAGMRLCGVVDATIRRELRAKIQRPQTTFGLESMQVDKHNDRRALLNLFVIKPAQTGFSAMAELTASAINNPEQTAVLGVRGESGDRDAELDLDKLTSALSDAGIMTFNTTDEVAEYVNESAEESTEFNWVEEATQND